ncbi:hypothetical protein ASE38_01995 [Cellulomonas sp. Root930]|nr:hypothetical protein ASE38_01995 [Cellulomonas sp. Root930]
MVRMADVELVEPSDPSAAPLEQRRRRRGKAWLRSAALVGAAAVVILTSGRLGLTTPPDVPEDYVLAQDHVLGLESVGADADEPKDNHGTLNALNLSADEMRRYEDVGGLSVWSGESRYGTTCLLVAHPGQGLREGIGAEVCSPQGDDPIADLGPFYSFSVLPPGVFADLPDGSVIRFALEGDHVNVYVFVRAADPAASRG